LSQQILNGFRQTTGYLLGRTFSIHDPEPASIGLSKIVKCLHHAIVIGAAPLAEAIQLSAISRQFTNGGLGHVHFKQQGTIRQQPDASYLL